MNVSGTYNLTGGGLLASNQLNFNTGVVVGGGSLSQYVMYTESEKIGTQPIYWYTGDICRGTFHTQDYVYINGNPIFEGKVTTKQGLSFKNPKTDKPVFQQGYTKGVDIPLTKTDFADLNALGTSGGASSFYNGVATYVEFRSDGKVVVRTGSNGWTESKTTMNPLATPPVPYCKVYSSVAELTSTTVLLVKNAPLHVKGTLDGKMTLGALGTGSAVWLDSSVVYKDRPPCSQNPTNVSDDLLGIVADYDIQVTKNSNNCDKTKGVTLNASIFSRYGGFGADQYSSRGDCGYLRVVGGIQEHERNPVGQSGSSFNGFLKDYSFDYNLRREAPAGYPKTPPIVQNWVDNTIIPNWFWKDDFPK
jgi:hypothetical protein